MFFMKVSSTSSFKTSKCYYDCAEAFDPSNVVGADNRGLGAYEAGAGPPSDTASYCASRNNIHKLSSSNFI